MRFSRTFVPVLLFAVLGLLFSQCRKDVLITDSSADLEFSVDTVLFDTVFTTIGSTTQSFKIYNTHKQPINISSIELTGGSSSIFRINVDGVSGVSHSDLEIAAEDSMWVFVEVTVNPNGSNNPMIVSDAIVFETNGNIQDVDLVAWGQDAYFHVSEVIDQNTIWNNDKPHVIYNYVLVDSSADLTINAGTQIHSHYDSELVVYKGSLHVNGVVGNPVVFQGDRLESFYDQAPGQWKRIWLIRANESSINHAVIKNAVIGVHMDTLNDNAGNNGLTLTNLKIENMSAAGVFSQTGKITAENLSVLNCGQFAAALTIGGEYNFAHCTFSSYYQQGNRQDPVFLLNNYFEDAFGTTYIYPLTNTRFDNCIIEGSNDEEFVVDMASGGTTDYFFNHCLIKTETEVIDATHFNQIFKNVDPGFIDEFALNVHLEDGAYVIDKGDAAYVSIAGGLDLDGNVRDGSPDLGCFEKQ